MSNLLRRGAAWLEATRHTHLTEPVTYARNGESVVVAVTVGRTQFSSQDTNGVLVISEARDFLIRAADLVIGGDVIEPQRGDTITDGDGYVYEVMPIDGEQAWRWSDAAYITRRIHTKLKASPNAG